MGIIFSVKKLAKYFPVGGKTLKAVDCLTFEIYEREVYGVVGESGSGKSTLGRCMLNLVEPTAGEVIFGDEIMPMSELARKSPARMKSLRRDMQVVFQNPNSSFNPKMTIGRALYNAASFFGLKGGGRDRIHELLDYVNLDRSVLSRYSNALSGGEMQRLAIVRALIPSPRFVMADEPVSALDVSVQAQILNILGEMKNRFGLTMMFISHELTVVEHICDRIMVMYLGAMMELGPVEELFGNPLHPYTRALLDSRPKTSPDEKKTREMLEGEIPGAVDIPAGCRFFSRCPDAVRECGEIPPELYKVTDFHFVACHLVRDTVGNN
ncbi:MAG: ABC transporter ATP-binding protein [Synergistaceae bacterium]|jgi:oligopeptide/dipeptide ABC transporter ATP-binding protein|nr:ABC transporter ATP-binding protein [Synergistaceae bacterium]